ncbi:hypothetical protein EDF64_10680 [Curtobacterium flaccumfaciens]|uniref:Uncharacterized protein n=1 Tax=Curtobacterium flaccumfaciens TaxID=2035 RepID=A0A4R6DGW6_9MICO|nr:hypothetical protein [Curtobacterium flaccumfaciens]TDN43907.1 hypothetical protein EDF64_10680 [Curtobacterium flaccumfaciens]
MNTEPPEGDDLQRMLVSMKRNVLERAAPRPKRRRGRSGLVIGVVALLAVGTATGAVALTLAQQDEQVAAPVQTQEPEPAPSATTPTSAPITASPTPRPTPSPNTVAAIPTTCRDTVPAEDYDRFFGETPVTETTNTEDSSTGSDSADNTWTGGAATILCSWMDPQADVTGLGIAIGTAGPGAADVLATSSLRCEDRNGGRMCQGSVRADPYPVDRVATYFLRGDTFIVITQTNFPTNGLLDAVVGEIWGD